MYYVKCISIKKTHMLLMGKNFEQERLVSCLLIWPCCLDNLDDKIPEHLIISVNWQKQLINPVHDVIFFPLLNGKTCEILRIAYNLILPVVRQKVLTDRRHRLAADFHFLDAIWQRIPCMNFLHEVYSFLLISQLSPVRG